MTSKLILFLVICLFSCSAFSQGIPDVLEQDVHVNISIKEHIWIDQNTYQFLEIEVRGLPDLNFIPKGFDNESASKILHPNIDPDTMGGAFDVPFVISKKQTLQPIYFKRSIEKNEEVKQIESVYTCLFLIDDFKNVRTKDLLLISNGVFGHPERSMAYFKTYVTRLDIELQDLKPVKDIPIASSRWYKSQTANLLDDNTFRRHHLQVHDHPYLREHTNYEAYLKLVLPKE